MASATSSGCPMRHRGVSSARASQVLLGQVGVHIGGDDPGGHAVHSDVGRGPSSLAMARVRPMIPALEAE